MIGSLLLELDLRQMWKKNHFEKNEFEKNSFRKSLVGYENILTLNYTQNTATKNTSALVEGADSK